MFVSLSVELSKFVSVCLSDRLDLFLTDRILVYVSLVCFFVTFFHCPFGLSLCLSLSSSVKFLPPFLLGIESSDGEDDFDLPLGDDNAVDRREFGELGVDFFRFHQRLFRFGVFVQSRRGSAQCVISDEKCLEYADLTDNREIICSDELVGGE